MELFKWIGKNPEKEKRIENSNFRRIVDDQVPLAITKEQLARSFYKEGLKFREPLDKAINYLNSLRETPLYSTIDESLPFIIDTSEDIFKKILGSSGKTALERTEGNRRGMCQQLTSIVTVIAESMGIEALPYYIADFNDARKTGRKLAVPDYADLSRARSFFHQCAIVWHRNNPDNRHLVDLSALQFITENGEIRSNAVNSPQPQFSAHSPEIEALLEELKNKGSFPINDELFSMYVNMMTDQGYAEVPINAQTSYTAVPSLMSRHYPRSSILQHI